MVAEISGEKHYSQSGCGTTLRESSAKFSRKLELEPSLRQEVRTPGKIYTHYSSGRIDRRPLLSPYAFESSAYC